MKLLILSAVIFLSGCSVFHEKPLPPSRTTEFTVKVVWVESDSDFPLRNMYRSDRMGMALYSGENCIIYAYKPYNVDDFKNINTLGHELLHCTDGHYHGIERRKNGSEHYDEVINRP